MNTVLKLVIFIALAASIFLFISNNNIVIISISGIVIIIASLLMSELFVDKKNAEKVTFASQEIYLIKQNSLAASDGNAQTSIGSFYSRTVGIIDPVIIFDKDKFETLSDAEKSALIYHEQYHVKEHHQLKRFLLYAGMIALFVCIRFFAIKENTPVICIGLVLLAAYIFCFVLFFRKNEFDADAYSVKEMKESATLTSFLENKLKNENSKGLSLHPSVDKRIENIK